MKTKLKSSSKIISLVLTLVMVLGMLPMMNLRVHAAVNAYDERYKIYVEIKDLVYTNSREDINKTWNLSGSQWAFYDESFTKISDDEYKFTYKAALAAGNLDSIYTGTLWTDVRTVTFRGVTCTRDYSVTIPQSFSATNGKDSYTYNLVITRSGLHGHMYGEWSESDYGTHSRTCSMNSTHVETKVHDLVAATCVKAEHCKTCGFVNGNPLVDTHDWTSWISNGDGTHTRVCKLSAEHKETIDCSYSTATCKDSAKCTVCGYVNGEPDSTNHTSTEVKYEQNSAEGHKKYNACCQAYAGIEAHDYNANIGACKLCGYQCSHSSYTDSVCDVCGYKCQHNIVDNNCTICGKQGIPYLHREWDDTTDTMIEYIGIAPADITVVTDSITSMSDGWYIVNGDVTVTSQIDISGTAHLILADGATLKASSGIKLTKGKVLYIYSQSASDSMGRLNATGAKYYSGIGNTSGESGTLIINGGIITGTGGSGSAGIGGGYGGSNGTVIINGGIVTAKGTTNGAGIGGGQGGNGGTVTINGGKVIAQGVNTGAGIGGGNQGDGGSVTINGGCVEAKGSIYAAGIGGSLKGDGGNVVITGGNVKVIAGAKAEAIGKGSDGSNSGTLKDGTGNDLTLNTITLSDASANTVITAINGFSYGLTDVKTLDTNKLYFYMAATPGVSAITAGGTEYICNRSLTYYTAHDWSNKDGVCACGLICEHPSVTENVCDICGAEPHTCDFTGEWKYDSEKHWKECTEDGCDKTSEEAEHTYTDSKCDCGYECPHEDTYNNLIRPVQNADGTWDKGKIVKICNICGNSSLVQEVERDHAGYEALEEAAAELEALLNSDELVSGTKSTYTDNLNYIRKAAYSMVYTDIETGLSYMLADVNSYIAAIEAGLADGTMRKADFSYMTSLFDEVNAIINGDASLIVSSELNNYWSPYYYYRSQFNNSNYSQKNYDDDMINVGYETKLETLLAGLKDGSALKADYTAIDEAIAEIEEKLADENVTDEAKAGLEEIKAQLEEKKADANTTAADLAELEKSLDEYEAELDAGIEDGSAVKADYTAIDEAIAEIEKKLADENVTDEAKAGLEEIKAQLEEKKADGNTSAADLAELEKSLDEYEAELDAGIEDGSAVKVNGQEIFNEKIQEINDELIEKYGEEEFKEFFESLPDEVVKSLEGRTTAIYNEMTSLEGSVKDNEEKIAEFKAELEAFFAELENCFTGTHNGLKFEVTEEAKCGKNAVESAVCTLCGEKVKREVEDSALTHSFTKYEVTEEAKCGVAGKKVAVCDHGCGETDEKEIPAREHIFVDYKSNGDATCTADGTKTAECIYNCGATDTVTDEDTMLEHVDEDGDKICDDCETEIKDKCPDCGGVAHEGPYGQYICMLRMIIRLITSLLKTLSVALN